MEKKKINKLAHIAFYCQLLKFQERVTFEIRKLDKRLMRLHRLYTFELRRKLGFENQQSMTEKSRFAS